MFSFKYDIKMSLFTTKVVQKFVTKKIWLLRIFVIIFGVFFDCFGEVVERYNALRRMVQGGRRFDSSPSPHRLLGFVISPVYILVLRGFFEAHTIIDSAARYCVVVLRKSIT